MMKKWSFVLLLLVCLDVFIMSSVKSYAEIGALSVKAILPENQYNKEVSYYDLRMNPGESQKLDLEIYNSSDKEETALVSINPGVTNSNGLIDYSNNHAEVDSSLKYPLPSIASTKSKVTVPPNGKVITTIDLKMPKEEFDGIIIGAVRITQPPDKDEQTSGGKMQIKNAVAISIGIRLTENDKPIKANLHFKRAFASQESGRNQVDVILINDQPINLEDITYKGEIYRKGSKKCLHKNEVENYRFAPNSSFHFPISWENEPFRSGDYELHLIAKSKKTKQKWEWHESFTIKSEEAQKLNKKAVGLKHNPMWMYFILGIIILLLLLLGIIWWRINKNNRIKNKKIKKKNHKKSVKKNKCV